MKHWNFQCSLESLEERCKEHEHTPDDCRIDDAARALAAEFPKGASISYTVSTTGFTNPDGTGCISVSVTAMDMDAAKREPNPSAA